MIAELMNVFIDLMMQMLTFVLKFTYWLQLKWFETFNELLKKHQNPSGKQIWSLPQDDKTISLCVDVEVVFMVCPSKGPNLIFCR